MIKIENASYRYPNGQLAVENINLTVRAGENIAIIGQNGAGKTTTVKLLNGLLKPTSGRVLIKNMDTRDKTTAEIAQIVGYVFQNPDDQLFNPSVYQELAYSLKKQQLPPETIKEKVHAWASLCGIKHILEANPYDLPLSIRKFVAIAAVLTIDPEVIIMDEPTAGLDHYGLRQLRHIIKILADRNKTIITITHDMHFVETSVERVIVMAKRQIQGQDTPEAIFTQTDLLKQAQIKAPLRYRIAQDLLET